MSYDDIIHLPRPVSKNHPPMSRENRAVQFAPFAALTGHGAAIREEARLTNRKISLTDEEISDLNRRLAYLDEQALDAPDVAITYFLPDERKSGGTYVTVEGEFDSVDDEEGMVCLANKQKIPLTDIIAIESDAFFKITEDPVDEGEGDLYV